MVICMQLMENLLLQYQDDKIIRIAYYERISSIIYAIDMKKVRWPYLIKEEDMIADYKKEKITILEDESSIRGVAEEELSKAEKEKRDRAWEIVNFIHKQVDSEFLLYKSKYRNQAIKAATEVYKVSYNTVKNYLVRFWKGGKVVCQH